MECESPLSGLSGYLSYLSSEFVELTDFELKKPYELNELNKRSLTF